MTRPPLKVAELLPALYPATSPPAGWTVPWAATHPARLAAVWHALASTLASPTLMQHAPTESPAGDAPPTLVSINAGRTGDRGVQNAQAAQAARDASVLEALAAACLLLDQDLNQDVPHPSAGAALSEVSEAAYLDTSFPWRHALPAPALWGLIKAKRLN